MSRVIPTSPIAHPPPPPPPRCRATPSSLPCTAQNPKPHHHHHQPPQTHDIPAHFKSPRRDALLLLSLAALLPSPSAAAAFSLGISGPKDWLRDQKKKASRFVLAPIDASRQRLRAAYLLLAADSEPPAGDSEEVRRLLNSAARDCVPKTRSSVVAFQAGTGVEVCTFRLIVKNASSLLDKGDPVKLETEATLDDLIRSFSFLGDVIDNSDFQLTSDRQKAKDGLMDTISALDKFEQGIKDCLGV